MNITITLIISTANKDVYFGEDKLDVLKVNTLRIKLFPLLIPNPWCGKVSLYSTETKFQWETVDLIFYHKLSDVKTSDFDLPLLDVYDFMRTVKWRYRASISNSLLNKAGNGAIPL